MAMRILSKKVMAAIMAATMLLYCVVFSCATEAATTLMWENDFDDITAPWYSVLEGASSKGNFNSGTVGRDDVVAGNFAVHEMDNGNGYMKLGFDTWSSRKYLSGFHMRHKTVTAKGVIDEYGCGGAAAGRTEHGAFSPTNGRYEIEFDYKLVELVDDASTVIDICIGFSTAETFFWDGARDLAAFTNLNNAGVVYTAASVGLRDLGADWAHTSLLVDIVGYDDRSMHLFLYNRNEGSNPEGAVLVDNFTMSRVEGDSDGADVLVDAPLGNANGQYFTGNVMDGFVLDAFDNNNMVVFDAWATAMEFTADMEILEGNTAAGLLFDVGTKSAGGDDWSALHIQPSRDESARVFCESNWSQAGGLNTENLPLPSGSTASKMSLKVSINTRNELEVYVNDMDTPIYSTIVRTYDGGYVGLCTYNTRAKFTNVKIKTLDFPQLDALELVGGELDSPFDPYVYDYTATVSATTDAVRIKASMDSGKITVNGNDLVSGAESDSIRLLPGYTDLTIATSNTNGSMAKTYTITVYKPYDLDHPYTEAFRPQFHYTPRQYWINDPNGMVYNAETGEYHLYYQHNPGVVYMNGDSHWGHAVSTDLVTWTEMPIAMYPDDIGNIASGSAVIDRHNTSGLFDESVPPESRMVVIYTQFKSGPGVGGAQQQAIAWTEDNGITWHKYEGNPVIPNTDNQYTSDFRDPKVMWMEDTQQWLMIVAGGRARLFTSPDLIHWTHNSDLFLADGSELESECPDLFPLTVEGTNEVKWVYSGCGMFCVVGDLVFENGKYHFVAETNELDMYRGYFNGNYGGHMYATQTFSNMPDGRVVAVSWMPDDYAEWLCENGYDKIWEGSLSLPMELGLKYVNGVPHLTRKPIKELESLRGDVIYSTSNVTVTPSSQNILSGKNGTLMDIEGVFTPAAGVTEFGFKLRQNDEKTSAIVAKYDMSTRSIRINTKTAGVVSVNAGEWYLDMQPLENGQVKLRILLDTSIIDLFGNDGLSSTHAYFYTGDGTGMELYAVGGNVTVDSLTIREMNSAVAQADIVPVVPVLTDLTLSHGTLSPEFHPLKNEYRVSVPYEVDELAVSTVFAWSTRVTGTVNGQEITMDKSGEGDVTTLPLSVGVNTVTIYLKDKLSDNTYTVTIKRRAQGESEEHRYDNACDPDCNDCGDVREVEDHRYDNACDADCNVCGDVREVENHRYDNACDTDCNECGDVREAEDHRYDNACDADCNVCGDVREAEDHRYDNACDADCNECGDVREVEDHQYDNDEDADCNECGDIREIAPGKNDEQLEGGKSEDATTNADQQDVPETSHPTEGEDATTNADRQDVPETSHPTEGEDATTNADQQDVPETSHPTEGEDATTNADQQDAPETSHPTEGVDDGDPESVVTTPDNSANGDTMPPLIVVIIAAAVVMVGGGAVVAAALINKKRQA